MQSQQKTALARREKPLARPEYFTNSGRAGNWPTASVMGQDKDFRAACDKEEIIANVKANPRNSTNQGQEPHQSGVHVFAEQLYKNRSVIEQANA